MFNHAVQVQANTILADNACEVVLDAGVKAGDIDDPKVAFCSVGAASAFEAESINALADLIVEVFVETCPKYPDGGLLPINATVDAVVEVCHTLATFLTTL